LESIKTNLQGAVQSIEQQGKEQQNASRVEAARVVGQVIEHTAKYERHEQIAKDRDDKKGLVSLD